MTQPSERSSEKGAAMRAVEAAQDALTAKMEREHPTIANQYRQSAAADVLFMLIGWMEGAAADAADPLRAGAVETLRVIKRLSDVERERHSAVSE